MASVVATAEGMCSCASPAGTGARSFPAETGKPVVGFTVEQNGDLKTIMDASRAAKGMVLYASELQREECSITELWISTKWRESDTTTGFGSWPTVGNMYDKLLPHGI
jgi:(2R)-sulfolactate sulfo-lyase subunit beta